MPRSSSSHQLMRPLGRTALLFVLALSAVACARTTKRPSPEKVREILARGSPYSESSFYACLLNGYEQGLPLAQIQKDCETKLAFADGKGFGPASAGDLLGEFGRKSTYFDPAKLSAVCHTGDGRVAGGPDGRGRTIMNYKDGRVVDWGENTWGGKGQCDSSGCYKGLTEEESSRQKKENIDAANEKLEAYKEAKEESEKAPSDPAKAGAARAAKEAAEKAAEKAAKDPNKTEKAKAEPPVNIVSSNTNAGGGSARPTGDDESPCEEALQTAREIVGECQRTGWKSGPCQELFAKLNKCADPTLIFVDPEAGYVCGSKIDPEAIKGAAVDRCHQLKRPVPGGPDPCAPPDVEPNGRYAKIGSADDWCHNLYSLVDPEAPDCLGTITVQEFGKPDLQQILVWGLNKLGGPIVYLPNRHPSTPPGGGPDPRPGPEPRPGPNP